LNLGIVILTTETVHHAYFVREMARVERIDWVLVETRTSVPPFETAHAYEARRDLHEQAVWFGGGAPGVGEFAEAWRVESVNHGSVIARLRQSCPHAVIVFGTGRLVAETISACGSTALNLHGGDPLGYRGLDSHLWAIYHRDWKSLTTTLHRVAPRLDCGDIVEQEHLALRQGMELHELRKLNTEACIRLATRAMKALAGEGVIRATPQQVTGRYYSHMPSVLKSLCVDRFAAHTRSLA